MRTTPTGKLCTRCCHPRSRGYVELDTMCSTCYERFVIAYWETMLAEAKVKLHAARLKDTDLNCPKDKEF